MNDFRKILTDFAKHLNESGQLKKGTAITDEVKFYLESKADNLPLLPVSKCPNKECVFADEDFQNCEGCEELD